MSWIVLALCSPKVHTRDGYRRWWQRVFRLHASLDLQVHPITVGGPPWNTIVHTEWTDHVTVHDGTIFTNHGTHDGRMRWGRITNLDYDWNQDVVRRACQHHADLGLAEATAAPVRD